MTWVITGLFYGLFMSFYTYINQKYKLNGYILGMWRGFGIMLVTFPIIFVEPFYFDPIYFILLTLQGLFIGYFDSRVFMASARFGAGGTSRTLVFSIVISTILWWVLHPADFMALWHRPWVLTGIIVALAGTITSYLFIIKDPFSKQLIKFMMPAVVVWSLMSTVNKEIMLRHQLETGIGYYLVYSMFISGLYNLYIYTSQSQMTNNRLIKEVFAPKVVQASFMLILFSIALVIAKSISLAYTPNTGYVNALSLTSPLWIILFNHYFKEKDLVSVRAGLVLIVCLFVLAILASM